MVDKVIFLLQSGGTATWTVPADWSNANKVECIGAGAGGRVAVAGGGGGGSGAYSSVSNITTLSPSQSVSFSVGWGGTAGIAGIDTWFGGSSFATSLVGAKGGLSTTGVAGGAGGLASAGIPASGGVRFSGYNGGVGNAWCSRAAAALALAVLAAKAV